jgi:hypothetical protein
MNLQVKEIYQQSEGRYLSESEGLQLESYANGVLASLDTMLAIKRAEKAIIEEVAASVRKKHTTLEKDHGADVELRVMRDQMMTLRYATFAMVLHDPNFIYDKFAVWFRTILLSFVPLDYALTGFNALVAGCKKHLTPADAEAVIPYINVVITEFQKSGGSSS